jgi:hypothetical protein
MRQRHVLRDGDVDDERILAQRMDGDDAIDAVEIVGWS